MNKILKLKDHNFFVGSKLFNVSKLWSKNNYFHKKGNFIYIININYKVNIFVAIANYGLNFYNQKEKYF